MERKTKIFIIDPEKFESIYLDGNDDKDDLDNAPSDVFVAVEPKKKIDNTDLSNFSEMKRKIPSSTTDQPNVSEKKKNPPSITDLLKKKQMSPDIWKKKKKKRPSSLKDLSNLSEKIMVIEPFSNVKKKNNDLYQLDILYDLDKKQQSKTTNDSIIPIVKAVDLVDSYVDQSKFPKKRVDDQSKLLKKPVEFYLESDNLKINEVPVAQWNFDSHNFDSISTSNVEVGSGSRMISTSNINNDSDRVILEEISMLST